MSEDNKLEQEYKEMIKEMATRAGSVVSDSYGLFFSNLFSRLLPQPTMANIKLKTIIKSNAFLIQSSPKQHSCYNYNYTTNNDFVNNTTDKLMLF